MPKNPNDKIRVCMIGGSGMGKTTFFSGLYQSLIANSVGVGEGKYEVDVSLEAQSIIESEGFFSVQDLSDEDAIAQAIANASTMHERYCLIGKDFDAIDATPYTTSFVFSLKVNDEICCDFEITDYAGELFDDANSHMEELKKLGGIIAESDASIIIAPADFAAANMGNDAQMGDALHAFKINTFFSNIFTIARRNRRKMSVLIALTKSDHTSIPDKLKNNNFAELSKFIADNIFRRTLRTAENMDASTGIIPVTAVGNNSTVSGNHIKPNANISQKNIDVAIFFCMRDALIKLIDKKDKHIAALDDDLRPLRHAVRRATISRRNELEMNIARLTKQRNLYKKLLDAINSDSDLFTANINELHLSGISPIN